MSDCAVVAAGPVHEEMSWLNAEAEANIYLISVTCDVFHFVILPLKVFLNPKPRPDPGAGGPAVDQDPLISVTKLVSQFGIVP